MLIISSKSGQLANRLFVFAHFIHFSAEHDIMIYNPSFDEYAGYFKGTREGLVVKGNRTFHLFDRTGFTRRAGYRIICKISGFLPKMPGLKRYFNSIHLKNDEDLFVLDSPGNIEKLAAAGVTFLSGWLFRCKNIKQEHLEFIREFFKPVSEYSENIDKNISDIRKKHKTVIGIHVRRGDYKTFQGGKYFYDLEQYLKIMNGIAGLFKNEDTAFLICSNEDIDLKIFTGLHVFKSTGHFVEDIYSLAGCDYIAGPPSTFTMWASFYGQKPLYVIEYPDNELSKESFKIIQL